MNKMQNTGLLKRLLISKANKLCFTSNRTILSDAYLCEEAWRKRLESPLLKDIKLDQYFVETDKKFGTKRLVSGIDLDLFASCVDNESQLDELEHLLYRFRRTKRAPEIMDSTTYAVVRVFLKFKQYESLFRILKDRENYGIFPDFYSYNVLMSTFLKEKLYKEAANYAILLMLQENFENKLSCLLALKSCQTFLNECSFDSMLEAKEEDEQTEEKETEEDEEDETLVRVPFILNPWFDDHFEITNPQHLIGKTLYLVGRELNTPLGRSYQLYGLALYEKWEKAANLLQTLEKNESSTLLSEAVLKVKTQIEAVPDDDQNTKGTLKDKFDKFFEEMKSKGRILEGTFTDALDDSLKDLSKLEEEDIIAQTKLFSEWEKQRTLAMNKQLNELDKERRLKVIEEKKEYLYWKEKLLFFFENEEKNLEESKKIEEMIATIKAKESKDQDSYMPPEMTSIRPQKKTIYQRLARVKKI